jgi:hypothetical protein
MCFAGTPEQSTAAVPKEGTTCRVRNSDGLDGGVQRIFWAFFKIKLLFKNKIQEINPVNFF